MALSQQVARDTRQRLSGCRGEFLLRMSCMIQRYAQSSKLSEECRPLEPSLHWQGETLLTACTIRLFFPQGFGMQSFSARMRRVVVEISSAM